MIKLKGKKLQNFPEKLHGKYPQYITMSMKPFLNLFASIKCCLLASLNG